MKITNNGKTPDRLIGGSAPFAKRFEVHEMAIVDGVMKMRELATNPDWARRFHRVLKSLPPELIDYKGITRYHQTTVDWLSQYDDGAPTPQGFLIK